MHRTITGKQQTGEDEARQEALRGRGELPAHVAIIMDGNGRWARQRGKARVTGHHEGVESVRDITEACAQLGIGYLTLYTFSTENWFRPAREVNALMKLLIHTIRRERKTLLENNIRLRTLGDLSQLPEACRREMEAAQAETAANTRLTLNLALSYSGRWDIVRAVREVARRVQQGVLVPEAVDEALVTSLLVTAGLPDPDLLIRTGGEQRLSNFLLWEGAYTELYFTERFWPAFRREQLYEAVRSYQDRDRRYGRVSHQESNGIDA